MFSRYFLQVIKVLIIKKRIKDYIYSQQNKKSINLLKKIKSIRKKGYFSIKKIITLFCI